MAGIGFTLKKLFEDESYTKRLRAYAYSALVAAGPWIAAVLIVNILLLMAKVYFKDIGQRDLFMGTIVYSFVFSQIITAPWQLLITRYISDKLYSKSYDYIRPSLTGLSKLAFSISLLFGLAYYYGKDLPIYYKYMSLCLFLILTLIWILMVYLSAIKNYSIISKAYVYGGILSLGLSAFLMRFPIHFDSFIFASNMLFAYLLGFSLTYGILLYSFLATFTFTNGKEYDFIRYLSGFKSLFFTGLFYVLGLWIDDMLMWYSSLGVDVYSTYRYAPLYDNAIFLAYLTIIPTMMLFMVSVETEFYDTYKTYYGLAGGSGSFRRIREAGETMKKSLFRQLIYTMETQTIISLVLIILSGRIFAFLGYPVVVKEIFRIAAMGALCNIFVLLEILVLLYFEARTEAMAIAAIFFGSNFAFTLWFIPLGVDYYGFGYFSASFITLLAASFVLHAYLKKIDFRTFAYQPVFYKEPEGFFISMADKLNGLKE